MATILPQWMILLVMKLRFELESCILDLFIATFLRRYLVSPQINLVSHSARLPSLTRWHDYFIQSPSERILQFAHWRFSCSLKRPHILVPDSVLNHHFSNLLNSVLYKQSKCSKRLTKFLAIYLPSLHCEFLLAMVFRRLFHLLQ